MSLVINIILDSVAVFLLAYFLPGIAVDSFVQAIIVALLLGIFGITIKPLLNLLTLPINLLTFGLFSFVVSAFIIIIVDFLLEGFLVDGFLWAIIFALLFSITSSFLKNLVK